MQKENYYFSFSNSLHLFLVEKIEKWFFLNQQIYHYSLTRYDNIFCNDKFAHYLFWKRATWIIREAKSESHVHYKTSQLLWHGLDSPVKLSRLVCNLLKYIYLVMYIIIVVIWAQLTLIYYSSSFLYRDQFLLN